MQQIYFNAYNSFGEQRLPFDKPEKYFLRELKYI